MLKRIRSLVSNSSFIEIYDNALSKKECDTLISQFEKLPHLEGRTQMGPDPDIKRCIEIHPSLEISFKKPSRISNIIQPVLWNYVAKYADKYNALRNHIQLWKVFPNYNIQKYEEGEGYYSLHCEHQPTDPQRIIVWMIY